MRNSSAELESYGRELVAAGFRVWLTKFINGYLTYEKDGHYGTFQYSDYEGWQHTMPIIPSREFGSSMFIGDAIENVWSVEAAEQTARETNHNYIVGNQKNAGNRTWISSDSIPLH